MNKLLSTVGLALGIATASLLAGCQLYFGDHSDGGGTSGGSASGSNGSGQPPGEACKNDTQCAAGCFCADGTCTEGGFCGTDKDCGDGFHCDSTRASCIPNGSCKSDDQCDAGSVCNASNGSCTTTCKCVTDSDAVKQGAGFCDEARETCGQGTDPEGGCTGTSTCAVATPRCAEGQVAVIKDGCYTGACSAITACGATPTCELIQHQDDCQARTDCGSVSDGHDCTEPDGSVCKTGDTNCSCKSFTFQSCETKAAGAAPNRIVIQ
jgi:hypothetical protein